jgi:outer membrane protein
LYELLATKATQDQQIINAENELMIAKIGLAQTLLIKDYVNFDIADDVYEIQMSEVMNSSPEQIANRAKEVVNDIKVAEANRDIAVNDVALARTAYAPRISAFFGYNTRWAESIPLPFEQQIYLFDGTSVGFQMSVPFLNGFSSRARVQRAKVNEERSNLLLEQATLDLERNVYQAYNDMINAQKSYEATQKTAEARKLAYDFAKSRYDIGMSNAFEMNQSQILYVNAASDVARAKYDFIFRVKVLEFYFGIPIIQKP